MEVQMSIEQCIEKLNIHRGGLIPVYCLSTPNLLIIALFIILELRVADISPLPVSMMLNFARRAPGRSLQENRASFFWFWCMFLVTSF